MRKENGIKSGFISPGKIMKKLLTVLFLSFLLNLCVFAQEKAKDDAPQEKPNFSGTWILDEKKSFSRSEERENISDYELVITHSGEELKIVRSYISKNNKNYYSEILYTDKRKENNVDKAGITTRAEIKSETFWKKQTIVRRFLYNKTIPGAPAYLLSNEKFSLSKDGKILTITTEFELGSLNSEMARAAMQQNGSSNLKRQLIFNKKDN
jgi:hypothetical protein